MLLHFILSVEESSLESSSILIGSGSEVSQDDSNSPVTDTNESAFKSQTVVEEGGSNKKSSIVEKKDRSFGIQVTRMKVRVDESSEGVKARVSVG